MKGITGITSTLSGFRAGQRGTDHPWQPQLPGSMNFGWTLTLSRIIKPVATHRAELAWNSKGGKIIHA